MEDGMDYAMDRTTKKWNCSGNQNSLFECYYCTKLAVSFCE